MFLVRAINRESMLTFSGTIRDPVPEQLWRRQLLVLPGLLLPPSLFLFPQMAHTRWLTWEAPVTLLPRIVSQLAMGLRQVRQQFPPVRVPQSWVAASSPVSPFAFTGVAPPALYLLPLLLTRMAISARR